MKDDIIPYFLILAIPKENITKNDCTISVDLPILSNANDFSKICPVPNFEKSYIKLSIKLDFCK
jgi:hypothetical protein